MNTRRLLFILALTAFAMLLNAQDADSLDVSIVLDASDSMDGGLLTSAKNASNQFIQQLEVGDEVAVSAYSNHAHTYYQMNLITSITQLNAVTSAVNTIETDLYTSIGAGMIRGLLEMNDIVSVNPIVGMILLSDGLENVVPMVSQVIGGVPGIVDIHTVGYGSDCDQGLMVAIANATGGSYHYAETTGITQIVQDIWADLICGDVNMARWGVIGANRPATVMHPVTIHRGMGEVMFNLCWSNSDANLGLRLVAPDGTVYDPAHLLPADIEYRLWPTQAFFRFDNPQEGQWSALIDPVGALEVSEDYFFTVSGKSDLNLSLNFDHPIYQIGDAVGVMADLTYCGNSISDAQITAVVERTDGSSIEFPLTASQFVGEGRGQYFGSFIAQYDDSYTVRLYAQGSTSDGAFTRTRGRSTYVGSIPQFDAVAPGLLQLSAENYPNPFNPSTTISFNIPAEAPVTLEIYNVRGQHVRTLVNETLPAGTHQAVWNGDDANGAPVASGIYFFKIGSGRYTATKKMILLK
ncbi:MAG: VWA domain-containing protein [Candidatus Cloacimonetes bacterium]|nr:VWA domain-containing protein [Candidatus Cloacimonadota bacterium]